MNRKRTLTRGSALALAAVLSVTLTLPAGAAEAIGSGVTPTYDEAYYATLDYYGNLLEGSVVKSYALNGTDSLTDFGVYDEVINLTDGSTPVRGEDSTSFRFSGGAPDHFYFEGKTKQPFEDLPWTLALRYTLNGVPVKAEDLAGQRGVVEILLDVTPNEAAGDYARYNYTLAATALFNQDDILSLEAEGAQVQLVGNLRTVLFLCLPGEEQHFTIRVGSNHFSFGGLTVMMMPATLAQLEEIAKLSQRKDDLEEDYRALSGSLDELLDALSDIQNGLYASAQGLDQLESARSTFSGGKGRLYDGVGALRGDLSNLADLLDPMEERVLLLSQTVTDSKAVLNDMTDATVILQEQLTEIEAALYGLEQGTCDLQHVIDVAGSMESSLLRLEHALGGSHVNTHSVATNSKAMVEKVKHVHGAYAAEDTETFLQKMLEAQGTGSADAKTKAAAMARLLAVSQTPGFTPDSLPAEQRAALAAAKQLEALRQAKDQTGMSFQGFCGQVVEKPEDAKMMNDLWLIYNAGGSTNTRTRADIRIKIPNVQTPAAPEPPSAPAPEVPAPEVPETPAPETPEAPAPEAPAPEVPEVPAPEVPEAPETPAPEVPETPAPEAPSPEDSAPEAPAPEAPAPQPPAPETPDPPAPEAPAEETPAASEGEAPEILRKGQMAARLVLNSALDDEIGSDGGSESSESDSSSGSGSDNSGSSGSDSSSGSGNDSSGSGSSGGSDSSGNDTENSGGSSGTPDGGSGSPDGGSGTPDGGTGTPDTGTGTPDTGTGTPDGGTGTPDGGTGTPDGGTPPTPGKPPENNTVGGAVVDLITNGLDSASARIDEIQYELTAALNQLKYPTSAVVGDLADLCAELGILTNSLSDAGYLMGSLGESSGTLREILADVDALRAVLNDYEPTLQAALANAGTLSASAAVTIRDTETLLADAESLARSTGRDLDAGTKQSLRGLSAALRQTAKALATTKQVKEAKNTVTQIIEDTWNEYTGDVNNILLMDATAEPVSLTDERNPAPTSIQVLIRTQEIKEEKPEEDEASAAVKEKTTFWGRVTQMFRDFWNAVTGVFQ